MKHAEEDRLGERVSLKIHETKRLIDRGFREAGNI